MAWMVEGGTRFDTTSYGPFETEAAALELAAIVHNGIAYEQRSNRKASESHDEELNLPRSEATKDVPRPSAGEG